MKLTTVIKQLEGRPRGQFWLISGKTEDAIKVACEAVKRCQEFRKYKTPGVYMPLPGETEDD